MDAASCDIQLKFALLMLRCESKLGEESIRHKLPDEEKEDKPVTP